MNMASASTAPSPAPEARPGFFGTFCLGVRVWAREMRRLMVRQAKLHELRQLEARLREETALLARLGGAGGPEKGLCEAQVALLTSEIARLRREQEANQTRPGGQG
jgi:hypothetical protein